MIHTANFRLVNSSIVVMATVNGHPIEMILDTGDAIGPVLNTADTAVTGAPQGQPFSVSGAGGASTSYETVIDLSFGGARFLQEPAAIDTDLGGPSLLGLPFFLRQCRELAFDFTNGILVMVK